MRVIVAGSRRWTDKAAVLAVLSELPPGTVIVHGGARGADSIAGEVAHELGLAVEVHPADWQRFGRSAGPRRNAEMVERSADLVIAFRLPGRSPGTDDLVRQARRAGIPVRLVYARTGA